MRCALTLLPVLAILLGSPVAAAPVEPPPSSVAKRGPEWLSRLRERVRLPERIARPLRNGIGRARGACTLTADRIEARLPGALGPAFHRIRLASPLALAAFVGKMVAEDPIFLTGFGIASTVVQHLEIPALIALGVNPGLAVAVHEITETPVNLALICWRQHHLRRDRTQTFLGTLRTIGRDYRAFVEARQAENRRVMANRAAKARIGSLGSLARALP